MKTMEDKTPTREDFLGELGIPKREIPLLISPRWVVRVLTKMGRENLPSEIFFPTAIVGHCCFRFYSQLFFIHAVRL